MIGATGNQASVFHIRERVVLAQRSVRAQTADHESVPARCDVWVYTVRCKPHVSVGAGCHRDGSHEAKVELGYRAGWCNATNAVCARLSKPDIAVGPSHNEKGIRKRHGHLGNREFGE